MDNPISVTFLIIVIAVVNSIYCFSNESALRRQWMDPYLIRQKGQYERLVTSQFIHADWMHLLFNMITLYSFGEIVEQTLVMSYGFTLGKIIFLVMYLMTGIIADLPDVLDKSNNRPSLGASGAVSGILLFSVLLYPANRICLYFAICMPGILFAILYLVGSWYLGRQGNSYINHRAHLTGALVGVGFAFLLFGKTILYTLAQYLAG